jgi:hypothetical protein
VGTDATRPTSTARAFGFFFLPSSSLVVAQPASKPNPATIAHATVFTIPRIIDPSIPRRRAKINRSLYRKCLRFAGFNDDGLQRRYKLVFSPNLIDWTTVLDEAPADGTPRAWLVPDGQACRFYRIDTTLEPSETSDP